MAATQIRSGQILDGSLTDADEASANKDGAAGTPCLRTLGTGAQQAMAGNTVVLSSISIVSANGVSGSSSGGTTPALTIVLGAITPTTVTATGAGSFTVTDALTNQVPLVANFGHNSSVTPIFGFGSITTWSLKDSTTNDVVAAQLGLSWISPTHGAVTVASGWAVQSSAGLVTCWSAGSSGGAATFSVLGAAKSLQLVSPDAGTALVTFGFASGTPTFACANLTGTVTAAQIATIPNTAALTGQTAAAVAQSDTLVASVPAASATITLTANEVLLKSSTAVFIAASVSLSIVGTAAAGANSIDTGSLAVGWYYIWVIYNGTTVAGLLSLSSTAPTMPATYTYKALVGTCRANSTTVIQQFSQIGRSTWWPAGVANSTVVSGHTNSVWTSISLTNVVPPNAKTVSGYGSTNTTATNCIMAVAGDSSGTGAQAISVGATSAGCLVGFAGAGFSNIPVIAASTIFYQTNSNTQAHNVVILGYTI